LLRNCNEIALLLADPRCNPALLPFLVMAVFGASLLSPAPKREEKAHR
jgi:hypothetical protein